MTIGLSSVPGTRRGSGGSVLIVEDQAPVARALSLLFDIHGLETEIVTNAADALAAVRRGGVDVVVQDMNFTPGATSSDEGTALFRRLRQLDERIPVVLLTAWTSLETAVQMVKEGATDYLAKPWDDEKLLALVNALMGPRRDERERRTARASLTRTFDLRGICYESAAMHRVVALALQVAASEVSVLITGPNGAGKEKIAEIIQANSRRRKMPFVKVNAGALPDPLLESELFGAEAGAFTGATRLRIGRFESANGGTLLLDEIGNLSASGQMKLLRILQNGEFERVGSSETRRTDVRLLCATNANLSEAVRRGTFREDLLFRLNVIEIRVPPLGGRDEDILPLAERFLAAAAPALGPKPQLSTAAREALLGHPWPGNVRELQNRIQRAVVTAQGEIIGPAELGLSPASEHEAAGTTTEKDQISALLLEVGGSISAAAKALGMSRQALYRRMERLGVVLVRRPRE